MKVTYLCERCGAIIGSLRLNEKELAMLDMDPLTADLREDIIKSTDGGLFVYTLCYDCVETMSLHESDLPYRRAPHLN